MKKINENINIFVSYHDNFYIPNSRYLVPIHVGTSNFSVDMISDNTGDNISHLNPFYCELTAQYWAWKNVDCKYYGFMHYRRYLSFVEPNINKLSVASDLILDNLCDDAFQKIGITDKNIEEITSNFDIILPIPYFLKYNKKSNTVYKQYSNSFEQDEKDLDLIKECALTLNPSFDKYFDKVYSSNRCCFCNIFIMKKEYFNEYCSWLFPILNLFISKKDFSNASLAKMRTPGYIAERLLNVFIEYIIDTEPNIRIKYLQPVFFMKTGPLCCLPAFPNKISISYIIQNHLKMKAAYLSLSSIIEHSSKDNFYDIFLLTNNISHHDKDLFQKLISNKDNFKVSFLDISYYINKYKKSDILFSLCDIFQRHNRIIYLAPDSIVMKDIALLYNFDIKNYVMAASINIEKIMATCMQAKNKGINDSDLLNYCCDSIMLIDTKKMNDALSSFNKYDKKNSSGTFLNCFKDKYLQLSLDWNVIAKPNYELKLSAEYILPNKLFNSYKQAKISPSIIFYTDSESPLKNNNIQYSDIYWEYAKRSPYFYEFISEYINNTKTSKPKPSLKNFVKKIFPRNSFFGNLLRRIYHLFR